MKEGREGSKHRVAPAGLRAVLGRGVAEVPEGGGWTLGAPGIDAATGGLAPGALHEAVPADGREASAAAGFAVALALRRLAGKETRPILWVARRDGLYEAGALSARGLVDLGADPGRFLLAAGRRDADVLWALEEALRSGAVALAVGEIAAADLVATRRLSLAAREAMVPALLLRAARALGPSAARTRWRIASAPSMPPRFAASAPGLPRWRLALVKGFRERPQEWIVEWDDEAHCFLDVAALAACAAEDAGAALARAGLPGRSRSGIASAKTG